MPPTMSTAPTMSPSTTVESRSGSRYTSAPKPTEHHEHRAQDRAPVGQLLDAAASARSAANRSSASLASSVGWKRHAPEAEPAPRAADHDPDVAAPARGRSSTPLTTTSGRTTLLPAAVVDAVRRRERDRAERGPDELPLEEVPRRAVARERHDRRRRQHHHDADDVEHADDGDEQQEYAGERGFAVTRGRSGGRGRSDAARRRWPRHRVDLHESRAPRARSRRRARAYDAYQSNDAHAGRQQDRVAGLSQLRRRARPRRRIELARHDRRPRLRTRPRPRPAASPIATTARAAAARARGAPRGRGPCCARRR